MKKKFIILTLCFTIIFSSINFNRSYADGGVISLPILATVSALAVGTGIVISGNDDLYDIGRLFYDYIDKHNDLTWATVQSVFTSSVSLQANNLVSVKSEFLDIVKGFFDSKFESFPINIGLEGLTYYDGVPYYDKSISSLPYSDTVLGSGCAVYPSDGATYVFDNFKFIFSDVTSSSCRLSFYYNDEYLNSVSFDYLPTYVGYFACKGTSSSAKYRVLSQVGRVNSYGNLVFNWYSLKQFYSLTSSLTFPYEGGYTWDDVENKKENESVSLPVPGDLSSLVGQSKDDFWNNTDNLVGTGGLSYPTVNNPSINLDDTVSFPNLDLDTDIGNPSIPDVGNPSIPNDSIWSTIKDFIIGLVVPSDTFWTDTWGGLYNNFTDSFPMVDMSGFNDLVTGEKKFPNIDINIMGITGRVVNGDVINSIVDWLRPIIAGFMMICLMLFNYRKIYKLIRNTEPFGGIAPGTSDFKTGISEYTHVGLVNDGFKRSEEEEFARSRYYEEMHFRNGGKL